MIIKLLKKYFWQFSLLSFAILSILNYGFVKDLYFWHEDYVYINSFFTQWYDHPYYQMELKVLYLFFLLFTDKPAGYFISALVFYILLSLTISIFAYVFTKNKLLAFLSGAFFSTGFVGEQNMLMVEIAITHILYLILAFWTLIFYILAHIKKSIIFWLFSLTLFIISIKLVPVRAHTLIVLLVLTEIYFFFSNKNRSFFYTFSRSAIRLSLFIVYSSWAYSFSSGGSTIFKSLFTPKAIMNLLADLGNYLIPAEYVTKFLSMISIGSNISGQISVAIGIILILSLSALVFIFRTDKKFQKLLVFLLLAWILTYLTLFWRESGVTHSFSFRYLFFGLPFYAIMVALVITRFFLISKNQRMIRLGTIFVILVVSTNLVFGYISPTRQFRLKRSFYLKKFIYNIKTLLPQISDTALFYFDVVYDPATMGLFNSFLQGGRAVNEGSLGFFYHRPTSSMKLALDYNDFVSQYKTGKYENAYAFYYSEDHKLTNLTSDMFSDPAKLNSVNVPNSKITQLTETDGLSIDVSSFPSYRPIQLDIDMRIDSFGNDHNIYPYPLEEPNIANFSADINKRRILLNYITQKLDFKKNTQTQGSEPLSMQYIGEKSTDNDVDTSWIANKQRFFTTSLETSIEMTFPIEQEISEIRWLSTYKNRIPIDYDYQVPDSGEGTWKTILSVRDRSVEPNKYVVDTVSKTRARKLKMIIYKTNGDSPAISEIEVLKEKFPISSEEARTFLEYPLAGIRTRGEAAEIVDAIRKYLKIKVYPITDKFKSKNQVHPVYVPIKLDGGSSRYSITLPPSGTQLDEIIIEFPNIPLSAEVKSVKLTLLPL